MNWLLWYLVSIGAAAVWVSGWCAGHSAGTRDAERASIEHREQVWAAYLAKKRQQNRPIAFGQPRGNP